MIDWLLSMSVSQLLISGVIVVLLMMLIMLAMLILLVANDPRVRR